MWFICCSKPLPVFDDAEIKAGEVSGDEGLEDTDGPAGVKLTVGVRHLQTHTDTQTHTHTDTHTHTLQWLSHRHPRFSQQLMLLGLR